MQGRLAAHSHSMVAGGCEEGGGGEKVQEVRVEERGEGARARAHLGRDVVAHPVDAADLVDDARGDAAQQRVVLGTRLGGAVREHTKAQGRGLWSLEWAMGCGLCLTMWYQSAVMKSLLVTQRMVHASS